MPIPIFQDVVKLILNLHMMRSPNIFMNVSMGGIVHLTIRFFDAEKLTTVTALLSLFPSRHLCPVFDFKISSRPNFALKSPNSICIWFIVTVLWVISLIASWSLRFTIIPQQRRHFFFFLSFYGSTALYGPGPPRFVEVSWSHTFETHHSR
jgi:hypothetical protein